MIYIGWIIYGFYIPRNEKIEKIFTPIDDDDNVETIVIGKINTYILTDKLYVKNEDRKKIGQKLDDNMSESIFGESPSLEAYKLDIEKLHKRVKY